MAEGKTYGISFPFVDSFDGKYLDLTDYAAEEIRTDLIHLILTLLYQYVLNILSIN